MRAFNRLGLLLLGLAAIGAGVITIVEVVSAGTGSGFVWVPGGQWVATLRSTPWSSTLVMAVSAAVGAAGLVLLAAQLRPWRPRLLIYQPDRDPVGTDIDWRLLRRSTQGHVSRRLQRQVPRSPMRARFRPGARRWRLRVGTKAAATSVPQIEAAAGAELARLRPTAAVQVRVTAKHPRRTA